MNTQVGDHRRRLADVAQALRLARTQISREQRPRAQLTAHQQQRLDTVVRHTATSSPFYRRWFAQTGALGAEPVELQRLPVLDKSLLMEHFDELVCDPRLRRDQLLDWVGRMTRDQLYLGRYRVLVTSGSSGRPGLFVYDPVGWRSIGAQFVRSSNWAGLRPSLPRQRVAVLGGAAPSHIARQGAATMAIGLHRVLALPVTLPLPQLVEALNQFQPTYLNVYPSVAMWLADEQQAGRLRLVAPDPGHRRRAAHPGDDPAAGGGVRGAPLLRLEVTDLVTLDPEPCPCGRTLIRISTIHGRSDDLLSLPAHDGGRVAVHPLQFALLTRDPQVREFQVVQHGPALRIRIVPSPAVADADDTLETRLGQAVTHQLLKLGVQDHRSPSSAASSFSAQPAASPHQRPLTAHHPGAASTSTTTKTSPTDATASIRLPHWRSLQARNSLNRRPLDVEALGAPGVRCTGRDLGTFPITFRRDGAGSGATRMQDDPLWYKTAVFYELYVRGFQDGNSDGQGDFRGLTERLDYLQWLGIDCIWLLPINQSPLRDGGYDISDYLSILPDYGILGDFYDFLEAAHARGLRVMADMVMNHTSDQHPWFQESRRPGSAKRDWYVWSDTDQKYLDARIIFVDTETSNWTWDHEAQAFYWHRFFSHQPDLNYDNPEVQDVMLEVIRFWLDMGLDGFRLDAVPYLFEREGTNGENLPETHEFLKRVRKEVDDKYPGRVLLAEANQWPPDVVPYFGDGDECHMAFNFPVMPRMFMALRREDRTPIVEIMNRTPKIPDTAQWGLFLRNHDELTLEMVTDEERDYMYAEYAKDPRMRRNIGISRRLAPLLDNGRRQIELLYSLLYSLPGSPVMYYGDEIGMGDNIYLGDRDGVRTPMQWTGDRNAGFSKADPAALYLPFLMDPVYGYQACSVEAQERVSTSLLQWVRRMLQVRKQHPVFGLGDYEPLYPDNRRVLAFYRQLEADVVLVVANLSRFAQPVELDLSRFAGLVPEEMFGRTPFPVIDDQPYRLGLGPHGFYWFHLVEPPSEPDDTAMFRAIRTRS